MANKPCALCGKLMVGVHQSKQYCPECYKIRHTELQRICDQKRRPRAGASKQKVKCVGCAYWRYFTSGTGGGMKACHYLLDTHIPRGVPAAECYAGGDGSKFEEDKRDKKRIITAVVSQPGD